MWPSPTMSRVTRPILKFEPCIFCQFRSSQSIRRYAIPPKAEPKYRVTVEQQKNKTPQQIRMEIDKRNRLAFLTMMKQQRMLFGGPLLVNKMIGDFLSGEKNNIDPATNVKQVAKKYRALVGDMTYIAIPLSRITDVKDPTARLPPSQHPRISASMLLACSAAGDVMATLQILSASYLSSEHNLPQARDIARQFTTTDVNQTMAMLERLAAAGDTDCMTMQGRFLERAGQLGEAKELYRKALETHKMKFNKAWPHPMALPWVSPWRALTDLLLAEKDPAPAAKAEAIAALRRGAFEGDDPLAYYQLSSFEDANSPEWLKYMSKAAASGHLEATYKLGHFYTNVSSNAKSFLKDSRFRSALKFLPSFQRGGIERYAREWFQVAALGGYKPAMLELAELNDDYGDRHTATEWLRRITEPPAEESREEWPRLVEEAKRRLAERKVASAKTA